MKTENFIEMKRRLLEEGQIGLDYEVADPIKNTAFFWSPSYPLLQRQNFSDTAQMLGYFSKHPEYLGYVNTKPIDLHSALGLTLMMPMTGEDAKALLKCQVFPGIPTSLIRAYRAKSGTFPINQKDLSINTNLKEFVEVIRDDAALRLFQASHLLPYVRKDTDLGLHAITFFPSRYDTPEKIREYLKRVYRTRLETCRNDEEKRWLKERMGSETEFVKEEVDSMNIWRGEQRVAIRTLEDLTEESLNFVREFTPEEYKRFSKAVSK